MSARVRWVPDSERTHCSDCGKKFTLLRRKHHCRRCGDLFCKDCANTYRRIPELEVTDMVRVCNRGCEIVYDNGTYGDAVSSAASRASSSPSARAAPAKKKTKGPSSSPADAPDFGGL